MISFAKNHNVQAIASQRIGYLPTVPAFARQLSWSALEGERLPGHEAHTLMLDDALGN